MIFPEEPNSGTYYLAYDGNGNVSEYLNGTGAVAAHYEYDPFGNDITPAGQSGALHNAFPFRFSTKYLDAETGLHNYGLREYNQLLGRWNSRDPIGEMGGVNLYGFIANKTISNIDCLGLLSITLNFFYDKAAEPFRKKAATTGRSIPWVDENGVVHPSIFVEEYAKDARGNQIFEDIVQKTYDNQIDGFKSALIECKTVMKEMNKNADFPEVEVNSKLVANAMGNLDLNFVNFKQRTSRQKQDDVINALTNATRMNNLSAGVPILLTGQDRMQFTTLVKPQAGATLEGISISVDDLNINNKAPYTPYKGILVLRLGTMNRTLAHELGHHVGWWDSKVTNVHSPTEGNLMYSDVSAKGNRPDCQWCERILRLAK